MSKNMSTHATNPQLSPKADYYLGCDVAKAKIDVSLINANGQELWFDTAPCQAPKIPNTVSRTPVTIC